MELQSQKSYGFGNNSLFQHQEARIIDELGFYDIDWVEHITSLNKSRRKQSLEECLSVPAHYRAFIESLSIPVNNQSWRFAKIWEAQILSTPKKAVLKKRNPKLERHLLGMELISRFPDRFDPKLVEAARVVQPVYSSKNTPDNARSYIQKLIDTQFDVYLRDECAGGRIHVCVKYDNEEQLQAMQRILNPSTRLLCYPDQLEGRVYRKKDSELNESVPEGILHPLLEAGTVFDDSRVIDGRTLMCSRFMGISRRESIHAMSGLPYDATDFEKRYKAKKVSKSDTCIHDAVTFPSALVIECLDGSWKVGRTPSVNVKSVESNSKLAKMANAASSAEELAIELSHPAGQRLLTSE